MNKIPSCVAIEYHNGESKSNLILYQSTNNDYRFKCLSSNNELIVPNTSIKKISLDYNFKLYQLDIITKIETVDDMGFSKNYLESNNYYSKIISKMLRNSKFKAWYKKAIIYSNQRDYKNVMLSLQKAKEMRDGSIEFAINDDNFTEIKDEQWFISLVKPKNTLHK